MVNKDRLLKSGPMMRCLLTLGAFAFVVLSCERQGQEDEPMLKDYFLADIAETNVNVEVEEEESDQVKASFAQDVRTELFDGVNVLWCSGDSISVFYGSTANSKYAIRESGVGGTHAVLNKVAAGSLAGGPLDVNIAFYPYGKGVSVAKGSDGYELKVKLPAVQRYHAGSFSSNVFPMIAITPSVDSRSLSFNNICSVVKLKVKGSGTVSKILFQGNSNEKLAGSAIVRVKQDTLPAIKMTGVGKEITLDCGQEGVVLAKGSTTAFHIVLPPTNFKKGFTAAIIMSDGQEIPVRTNKKVDTRRTTITEVSTVNIGAVWFEDKNFKNFCLSKYDLNHDGQVSYSEAAKVKTMNCAGLGIKHLTGIEHFISLNHLICYANPDLTRLYLIRGIDKIECSNELQITYKKFDRPLFSVIDDDFNTERVDDLYDICNGLGIKCDFALIPYDDVEFVDSAKERLKPYMDAGHEFLLHPWHECWYDDNLYNKFIDVEHCELSLARIISTFNATEGLDRCSDCLVYPGNSSNREAVREMCSRYVWMGITSGGHCNTDLSSPYNMQRFGINMDLGKTCLKQKIKDAAGQNAWLIFAMHISAFVKDDTVDEYSWTTGNLRDVLEYAQSLGEFKSYSEVVHDFAHK